MIDHDATAPAAGGPSLLRAHDPTLEAAATLAERQADHVRAEDAFVDAHLSHLDAFSGVLSLFRDEYSAALGHVHAGLEASASRAWLLRVALLRCREEYADADGLARDDLRHLHDGIERVRVEVPAGVVGPAPAAPDPSDRDATGLRDALRSAGSEESSGSGPQQPGPEVSGPGKPDTPGRHHVRDRDGSIIESPGQTLLDEAQGLRDSVSELRDGLADLGESARDVEDYRDFVGAS